MRVPQNTWGSPKAQNRDQPEVQLSWKLVPFLSMRISENTPSIRHFDAILTPSWKVPRHFWPLSGICRLRKLTFCSCIRKKPYMRCARRHARGHKLQKCWHRVGLRVDLYSVPKVLVMILAFLTILKIQRFLFFYHGNRAYTDLHYFLSYTLCYTLW